MPRFLENPIGTMARYGASWAAAKALLSLILAASIYAPSPSLADSPLEAENSEAETSEREDIRIVGFASGTETIDDAVPAILVDQRQLQVSIPQVLTDALRGVRDVALQTTTPGQGSPFIRGLTGSGVLNLVDGMRLNNAIYRSAPTPYLALVEPRLIERIEIVRGPASVRHGSDAMGGVIQLHTRRPEFEGKEWETRSLVQGIFNSADLARGIRVELEGGNQKIGLRGGFSGLETGNLEGGGDTGRQIPSAYSTLGGDFSLDWKPTSSRTFSVDVQYAEQPKSPRYDEMSAGFDQPHPSSSEFYYEPLSRLFTRIALKEERPTPYFDSLGLNIAFQKIRDDRRTRAYQSDIEIREQNTSELLGITLRADKDFEIGFQIHWGVDAYLDWVSSARQKQNLQAGTSLDAPSRFPNGSSMHSYGAFADISLAILPSLTLDGGLRYSYIDTEIAATASTPQGRSQLNDLTGSIGLLFEPWVNTEFIASFRRGFRAPNIFDLGTLGPRPGNRYNQPSNDLTPEIIYTTDFGFRHLGEIAQTEIFFYYSHYDNKIESIDTNQKTPDGRDIVQSANTAEVRITGIEAFERIRLNESVALEFSFFWTWGEESLLSGGFESADRIPPLQGRLGFPWQASDRLWIEPFMRFAASQPRLSARDQRDPRINPLGSPSWATFNIQGHYRWDDQMSFSAELRNLTNASYREHGSGIQAQGIGLAFSFRLTY